MSTSSYKLQKKGEDGMGKAGIRKETVEDRSSGRLLCDKVGCEKVGLYMFILCIGKSMCEFCGDRGQIV